MFVLEKFFTHLIGVVVFLIALSVQANVPGGGTGTGGNVTVTTNGTNVTLANGIVSFTINTTNGNVTNFTYNGTNLLTGGNGGGYFYFDGSGGPTLANPTYTLTVNPANNGGNQAEVFLQTIASPMDMGVYYDLLRGQQGIYNTLVLTHEASYVDYPGAELRSNVYVGSAFDWIVIDPYRFRQMASPSDTYIATPGAPAEVFDFTSGIYSGTTGCKYSYSDPLGELNTWGWASTTSQNGIWQVVPSHEYYDGGPLHRELTAHLGNTLLNMFGGGHYGFGLTQDQPAGTFSSKTFGPAFIYANTYTGSASDPVSLKARTLWADSQAQAVAEQGAWPYTWFNPQPLPGSGGSAYPQASGRGTVSGTLTINDPYNSGASPVSLWVGMAPVDGGVDFQQQYLTYQFWVRTGAGGTFTIPNVVPGTYNLWAFGPGGVGTYEDANLTVNAGQSLNLGTLTWAPLRLGPTVWEIGTPDRDSNEFNNGDHDVAPYSSVLPPYAGGAPYNTPADWAAFLDYATQYPNGVSYVVGTSHYSTDWNYCQPTTLDAATTTYGGTTSKIYFNLATAPTAAQNARLYIAFASVFDAACILTINGTVQTASVMGSTDGTYATITNATTGFYPPNVSFDSIVRLGTQGSWGDAYLDFAGNKLKAGTNEIDIGMRATGGAGNGNGFEYDYVRLELTGYATSTPTPSGANTATYTTTPTKTGTPTATNTSTATRTWTTTYTTTRTPTATMTQTYTATWTNTPTASLTRTATGTPTRTLTSTATQTNTSTPAFTTTNSPTATWTSTSTASFTRSATSTWTSSSTPTATETSSFTASFTRSATPTLTGTDSPTVTATLTYSSTPSKTFTALNTTTSTSTPSVTPTPTMTSTATPSSTATSTRTFASTPTATETSSFTASFTRSATPTLTGTYSPTATATLTYSFTATKTSTPVNTPTITSTPVLTPSVTLTYSMTSTSTQTRTPTWTPTATATGTVTGTWTATDTASWTHTPVSTPSATSSSTSSPTPIFTTTQTLIPVNTVSPTVTSTPSSSSTHTATATQTETSTPNDTVTTTPTVTLTISSSPTNTSVWSPTPSFTHTGTATPTWSFTSSSTPTPSATWTTTLSPVFTPTSTPTGTMTTTVTLTATPSSSLTPTHPYTSTQTLTATSTPTPSVTWTRTPTVTSTLSWTSTNSFTPTFTSTLTATSTPTWTLTYTPTVTSTWTSTQTTTWTNTPTFTPTVTVTATAVPWTPTATSTPTGTSTPGQTPSAVIYPNPAPGPGPITLQLTLPKPESQVTISVYTTAYRRVNEIILNNVQAGTTEVPLPLTSKYGTALANGLYYVVVKYPQGQIILKLLVLR